MNIIMVLGAPNSPGGALSEIALGRLETALDLYRQLSNCRLLLTGGFGAHFNVTTRPAAYYMARFLIEHGVTADHILPFVLSANTVEDAALAKEVLSAVDVDALYVVTSSFHMPRAQWVCKRAFAGDNLFFVQSPNRVSEIELERLRRHEDDALRQLQRL